MTSSNPERPFVKNFIPFYEDIILNIRSSNKIKHNYLDYLNSSKQTTKDLDRFKKLPCLAVSGALIYGGAERNIL